MYLFAAECIRRDDCECEPCIKKRAVNVLLGVLIPTIRRVTLPGNAYRAFNVSVSGVVDKACMITWRMFDSQMRVAAISQTFHTQCGEMHQNFSWAFDMYGEISIEASVERECRQMRLEVSAVATNGTHVTVTER